MKTIDKKSRMIGTFKFEFDEKSKQEIPTSIHLIPIGEWNHDAYGPILITVNDIREFAANFNAGIRNGVYITAGHEGYEELPAQGWIKTVELREDGLWGNVEWNKIGIETLSDRQYKFISPEFYRDYEDPQTHQIYRNVLIGAALTKSPYFKELAAVMFSDKNIKKQFNENNNNIMNLQELLAKDINTLTDEEKAFIKENSAELTDDQKVSHASILEVDADDTEEKTEETSTETEKTEEETTEEADKDESTEEEKTEDEKTEDAPEGDEKIEASEKNKSVMISASELAILKDNAAKGEQAFAELRKNKLDTELTAMIFNSESNKSGKFLPKSADNLRSFMEVLNDKQLLSFKEIVNQLPKLGQFFNEAGAGAEESADATAQTEIEAKVNAKIEASEGGKMSYSEALKEVVKENPGLYERYNDELAGK